MNNKNLQSYIDQIINMQLSVTNIRPISKKWLLLTTVGAGVYTSSDVKLKNVLGQGGVIFIRQFKSNLSLGAGLAVTTHLVIRWYFLLFILIGALKDVIKLKFRC